MPQTIDGLPYFETEPDNNLDSGSSDGLTPLTPPSNPGTTSQLTNENARKVSGIMDLGKQNLSGYTPELTSDRLTGLLSSDNPYMKQAKTAGTQMAAQRGLLNSSMAAGASQGAAIQAAAPIAQQDAADINRSREYGASTLNQANMTSMEAQVREQLAQFDQERAMQLQDLKSRYEVMVGRDEAANKVYQQYMAEMGNILTAIDLSAERRQQALDQMAKSVESQMKFIYDMGYDV